MQPQPIGANQEDEDFDLTVTYFSLSCKSTTKTQLKMQMNSKLYGTVKLELCQILQGQTDKPTDMTTPRRSNLELNNYLLAWETNKQSKITVHSIFK